MSSASLNHTVLVVDDQRGVRQLIRRILEMQGYAVADTEDGPTALERFGRAPEPTLAIIDITMPGMDGVTLADQLRRLRPALPIILMSGFDMDDVFEPGVTITPPAAYLEKPFDVERLTAMVERLLAPDKAPGA
jgi:CheY-like chemotaxis protein